MIDTFEKFINFSTQNMNMSNQYWNMNHMQTASNILHHEKINHFTSDSEWLESMLNTFGKWVRSRQRLTISY